MRILGSPEDTEDVLQETLLKIFRSISNFREQSSLYTWLHRIMVNESLVKLRQRRRHQVVSIEDYLPRFDQGKHVEHILDWSRPDRALDTEELLEFLEKCITELPADYQLPYIFKDVEKMSENQVCDILQIRKTVMKNRVHRARLVIRKRVEDHFFKPGKPEVETLNHLVGSAQSRRASKRCTGFLSELRKGKEKSLVGG